MSQPETPEASADVFRSMGKSLVLLILLGLTGCASRHIAGEVHHTPPPATPCEEVIPECHAERLPNVIVVTGTPAPDGLALGPVTGSIDGTIEFDDALRRAWQEDGYNSKTVQVVLGSADPKQMHWDSDKELFYGILWGGVCEHSSSLFEPSPGEEDSCFVRTPGTIIDAYTGSFIVGH